MSIRCTHLFSPSKTERLAVRIFLLLLVSIAISAVAAWAGAVVVNPRVSTDSSIDASSAESVFRQLHKPGMTDEEKVVACWRFMLDHFYHWHPPQEASVPSSVRDFAKAVNSYGYGPCFVNAPVLCALWESAGFESRAWRLSGHTVAEVRYDGAWHMLDADARGWHRGSDGQIASVEHLTKDASLFLRPAEKSVPYYPFAAPDIVATPLVPWSSPSSIMELYLSQEDNHLANQKSVIGHPMFLTLRHGEKIVLSSSHVGKWNRTGAWYLPEHISADYPTTLTTGPVDISGSLRFGNGELVWQPDLARENVINDLWLGSDNVKAGSAGLVRLEKNREGVAVFRVWSPYVMVGATAQASTGARSKSFPAFDISTDGGNTWIALPDANWRPSQPDGSRLRVIDLSGQVTGTYEYLIRAHLGATTLTGIKFATIFQLAPLSMPTLKPGPNTITVSRGPDEGHVQLVLGEKQVGRPPYIVSSKGALAPEQVSPEQTGETCTVIYRLSAPDDLTRISVGANLSLDKAADQFVEAHYSLDHGKSWAPLWRMTNTQNSDDSEFEIDKLIDLHNPGRSREVLVKLELRRNSPVCAVNGIRLYGFHRQPQPEKGRLAVTIAWKERHGNQWQEKNHALTATEFPHRTNLRCEGEEVILKEISMTPK